LLQKIALTIVQLTRCVAMDYCEQGFTKAHGCGQELPGNNTIWHLVDRNRDNRGSDAAIQAEKSTNL
jgi:hypothetical protein